MCDNLKFQKIILGYPPTTVHCALALRSLQNGCDILEQEILCGSTASHIFGRPSNGFAFESVFQPLQTDDGKGVSGTAAAQWWWQWQFYSTAAVRKEIDSIQ